ncbi:MAG: type II secretion system secretin GspD [Oceanospirillaceae bacterium]|nr:type II secretion system secretin GspD [Oceanospirillaceae bacterium]
MARLLGGALLALALALASLHVLAADDDGYSLDMRDTDIAEFIATVGKLTGRTIVVDPRVKGKVSIRSPKPVSKEELYEIFLVQLGVQGFSVVDVGDSILKVIPQQAAKLEGVEVQDDSSARPASSENIVTRVVSVRNIDVDSLIPVLRPLVDNQSGIIAPYPASNVVLITDREANVRRLLDIIARIDGASSDDSEVIQLQNASAQEVGQTLSTLVRGKSGGDGSRPAPRVTADSRTNSLVVQGDEAGRAELRQIIRRLDGEVRNDNNTRVHYLRYAKAAELAQVLESVSGTLTSDGSASAEGASGSGSGSRDNIHIEAHEATNSIVLSGSPALIASLGQLIEQLDIRRAQVMVEAIIVELSENRAKELGVQWLFADRDSDGLSGIGTNYNNLGNGLNALIGGSTDDRTAQLAATEGLSAGVARFDASGINFGVLLKALEDDGESNILSTPSLVTMDNEEASILVGREVPIVTGQTIGDNNSNPFQTIERRDVGVKLNITPQINEGSAVQLKIVQEVSSLTGLSASDIITDKREIRTSVMVDDGATIVLGGLIDDDVQQTQSKVPLLGDLPWVGRLFRSDSSRVSRRNLMVFIRPTIIRDRHTLTDVSSAKYGYIRARQLLSNQDGIALFPDEAPLALPEWTGMGPASFNLLPPEE